jgi:Transposase domain (DUF772)
MRPSTHSSDDQLDAATWCRHLIPDGSVDAFLADHRHQLFPGELFADLVVHGRGRPSVPTQVVATVMVLQALEGLSDREAVSALRRDIAWKVACGLRLDDEGFHPAVLVYWRARLRASERPRRIFEAVRQVVGADRGAQGSGPAGVGLHHLDGRGCHPGHRHPTGGGDPSGAAAGGWGREVELAAHDYDRPGKPDCAWDDPQATQALVSGLVTEALRVLAAVAEVDVDDAQAEAASANGGSPGAQSPSSPLFHSTRDDDALPLWCEDRPSTCRPTSEPRRR